MRPGNKDSYYQKLVDFIEGSNDLESLVDFLVENDDSEDRQVVKARLIANKVSSAVSSLTSCASVGSVVGILMLNMFVTAQAIKEITSGALNSDDLLDLVKMTDVVESNLHIKQDESLKDKTHAVLSYITDMIEGNDPVKAGIYDPQPEDGEPLFVSQYIGNLIDDLEENNVLSVNGNEDDDDESDDYVLPDNSEEENAFFRMLDDIIDDQWGQADQDQDIKH